MDSHFREPKTMRPRVVGLLVATICIAVFVGYAVSHGLGVATVFGILLALVCIWVVRARRSWSSLRLRERVYGSVLLAIFLFLLAGFVVSVEVNPSFARERNVRRLQRVLNHDARFSCIHVKHLELKYPMLRVDGMVYSDHDLPALRELIWAYDWHSMERVYWNVVVGPEGRKLHGWDRDVTAGLARENGTGANEQR